MTIKAIIRLIGSDTINIYTFKTFDGLELWLADQPFSVLYTKQIDKDIVYIVVQL